MGHRSKIMVLVLIVALMAKPVCGGFFGGLWDGVKSVASAPVRAVGWLVGQGVNSAIDPSLDNAFGRLRDTTDHAINRFDSVSASRIGQLDEVAKERLKQLDDVAKQRITQIDEVLKARLDQTDRLLDSKLNRVEEIGIQLLDREAKILDENITRVEDILTHSLDRLQEIETNAFDRVEAALQDQVPFAASQVARTMEWTSAIIVFIVVLVGFGGVELLRRISSHAPSGTFWQKLVSSVSYVPKTLLLVGVPMLFLFGVIQLGYLTYCNRADAARVARVEDAAHLLELAGDFKSATSFRKRAFALDGETKKHYMVVRDTWLTSFWQKHIGQDSVELLQRLNYLRSEPKFSVYADADPELIAAAIYIRASYTADSSGPEIANEIKKYKDIVIGKAKRQPVLGKLVYMAEAKLILNNAGKSIDDRLQNAASVVDELLGVQDYKRYAPGLVLRSQLAVHQLELEADRLTAPIDSPKIDSRLEKIRTDVEAAFAADPNLARYIRFRSKPLPKELETNLRMWAAAKDDARKALKDGQGKLLSDRIPQQFDEYAAELDRIIKPLVGVDILSKSKVERQIMYSMRSTLGEGQLKEQIELARKNKRDGKTAAELFASCSAVAEIAAQLGKLQLAESWLNEAEKIISASPDAFKAGESEIVKQRLLDIRRSGGHPSSEGKIPKLTEVMFYVF